VACGPRSDLFVRLLLDEHLSPEGTARLVHALDALRREHPERDAAIRRGEEIWLDD